MTPLPLILLLIKVRILSSAVPANDASIGIRTGLSPPSCFLGGLGVATLANCFNLAVGSCFLLKLTYLPSLVRKFTPRPEKVFVDKIPVDSPSSLAFIKPALILPNG